MDGRLSCQEQGGVFYPPDLTNETMMNRTWLAQLNSAALTEVHQLTTQQERDSFRGLPMSIEDDVKAANTAFYTAFRDRDMAAMEQLWAGSYAAKHPLCCIHPGQAPIFDRRIIIQSWEQIMKSSDSDSLNINSRNEHVLMYDPAAALVVCEEDIVGNTRAVERLTATNAFVYQNGGWKICHHHAGRRQ